MDDNPATTPNPSSLESLFPELRGKKLKKFKPCATYNEHLDWLIWLDEDVGYVAHPLHPGLDVLRHPQDGHVVGFKIISAKALYKKAGVKP